MAALEGFIWPVWRINVAMSEGSAGIEFGNVVGRAEHSELINFCEAVESPSASFISIERTKKATMATARHRPFAGNMVGFVDNLL